MCSEAKSVDYSSTWKDDGLRIVREIPHILCNPNVNSNFHKRLPRNSILSQINPLRNFVSNFTVTFYIMFQLYVGLGMIFSCNGFP